MRNEKYLADLVCAMITSLVDKPGDVKVTPRALRDSLILDVNIAAIDVGKVIGKHGRTARSLRTILGGASAALGVRCELNIIEEATT